MVVVLVVNPAHQVMVKMVVLVVVVLVEVMVLPVQETHQQIQYWPQTLGNDGGAGAGPNYTAGGCQEDLVGAGQAGRC